MNEDRKKFFLGILGGKLTEVEKYLGDSLESAEAVSPDKSIGRLSRMEAMQDQQLVLEMRRRKKRQLVEIRSALDRLQNGGFGYCILCQKEIGVDRLEAFPEVPTCVSCS